MNNMITLATPAGVEFNISANGRRRGIFPGGSQAIFKEKVNKTAFGMSRVQFAMTANGRSPQHIGKAHSSFRLVKITKGSIMCYATLNETTASICAARVVERDGGLEIDDVNLEEDLELQMAAASAALTIAEGGYFAYPEHQRT